MILMKDIAEILNSHKVATRIRSALCGSLFDIQELKSEPLAEDLQIFGINHEGFEILLQCNPLLQEETLESIKTLADKFVMPPEVAPVPVIKQAGEEGSNEFAALFNRA